MTDTRHREFPGEIQDLNLIGQHFYRKIALHISIPERTHDHLNEKRKYSNAFCIQFRFRKDVEPFFAAFEAESEKVLAKK